MLLADHMPALTPSSHLIEQQGVSSLCARECALAKPGEQLRAGLPARLEGPLAWSGETFGDIDKTVIHLSNHDIHELDGAIQAFRATKQPLSSLSPTSFPLPGLTDRLMWHKNSVHQGHGFAIIRGIDPRKYSDLENVILHVGLCSYFGRRRALQQNYKEQRAEVLLHVTDVGRTIRAEDTEDRFLAPGNLNIAIGFHSDNGDNVSLYCRQPAAKGGDLCLSPAWTIYNDLAANWPETLNVLCNDWEWQASRVGEEELRSKMQPLFYVHDDKLVVNYQKRPLRGTREEPRDARLTPLSEAQNKAIEIVDWLAFKHALPVTQKAGDIHIFNNLCVLHARSAFMDDESEAGEISGRRHLQRLIFRDEMMGWEIPSELRTTWAKYYDHADDREIFPLAPKHWAFSLCGHD